MPLVIAIRAESPALAQVIKKLCLKNVCFVVKWLFLVVQLENMISALIVYLKIKLC